MKSDYIYRAKIVNICNPSSFSLLIDLGFDHSVIKKVELFRVKPVEIDDNAENFLNNLLINKEVLIKSRKSGNKYIVEISAEISGSKVNLSSYLLSLGYVEKI
jgi:hypothetical protein